MASDGMQAVFVYSDIDQRKFKMVMKGDLAYLSVDKIKRYLHKSTGLPPEEQHLTYNGMELSPEMIGKDFGLAPNAVLSLARRQASKSGSFAYPSHLADLAEDVEGKRRQQQHEGLGNSSVPTNLAPESLFDRAARMQRMTSPRTGSAIMLDSYSSPPQVESFIQRHTDPAPPRLHSTFGGEFSHPNASTTSAGPRSPHSFASAIGGSQRPLGAPHPLETKLAALQEENLQLRQELERMKREQVVAAQLKPTSQEQLLTHAKNQLLELGKELGMHLAFDANFTCVVGSDERNTIIVTCDIPTERLYIYSTLASTIPEDPALRMRFYETLLEGAMLGRDMAGGGCGIALSTGVSMMSTSIDLRHSDVTALRETAPVFVESLIRWRNSLAETFPRRPAPLPPE